MLISNFVSIKGNISFISYPSNSGFDFALILNLVCTCDGLFFCVFQMDSHSSAILGIETFTSGDLIGRWWQYDSKLTKVFAIVFYNIHSGIWNQPTQSLRKRQQPSCHYTHCLFSTVRHDLRDLLWNRFHVWNQLFDVVNIKPRIFDGLTDSINNWGGSKNLLALTALLTVRLLNISPFDTFVTYSGGKEQWNYAPSFKISFWNFFSWFDYWHNFLIICIIIITRRVHSLA